MGRIEKQKRQLIEEANKRLLMEQNESVEVEVRGPMQDECDNCDEEQLIYVIYDLLKNNISDSTDISTESETNAVYDIQNYKNVDNVKELVDSKLKKLFPQKQILCNVQNNKIFCEIK